MPCHQRMFLGRSFVIACFACLAVASNKPAEAVTQEDSNKGTFNFTEEVRDRLAKILEKDDREVDDHAAILQILIRSNKPDLMRAARWNGDLEIHTHMDTDGVVEERNGTGEFIIDFESDSIYSIHEWEQPGGNIWHVGGEGIQTPEHNLIRTASMQGGNATVVRGMRNSSTYKIVDPRLWGINQRVSDFLGLMLVAQETPGFWDRASLSVRNVDGKQVYVFKAVYSNNNFKAEDPGMTYQEMAFREDSGFHITSTLMRSLGMGFESRWQIEYEDFDGGTFPAKAIETRKDSFGEGKTRVTKKVYVVKNAAFNVELKTGTFDRSRFEVQTRDIYMDSIEGRAYVFLEDRFQEVDPAEVDFKSDMLPQMRPRPLAAGETANPIMTRDRQMIQFLQSDELQLLANDDGSLSTFVLSRGKSEDASPGQSLKKYSSAFCQIANEWGTGISKYSRVTIIPDENLTQEALQSFVTGLQFQITLPDGSEKMIPEIVVEKPE